ncbi:MAG: prepilin-type N-terminal cleavage/methylation domain-containing protein [Planctomycetota bacterium]
MLKKCDSNLRCAGLSLIEVTVALTVLALILMTSGGTILAGMNQRRECFQSYQAMSAVRDLVAEMQDVANLPQDLLNGEGIGAIFGRYTAQSVSVTTLNSANIAVTCHPNETTVPAELGGPQDLNFDGDALDDLGNLSAGTDLKIVPMTLTVTFGAGSAARSMTFHRLIAQTSF